MFDPSLAKTGRILGLIFVACWTVFAGILMVLAWMDLAANQAAAHWPSAPGKVIVSGRKLEAGRRGSRSVLDIRYLYTVGNSNYSSWRIAFRQPGLETLGRYPVGTEVKVYYNPGAPATVGWLT